MILMATLPKFPFSYSSLHIASFVICEQPISCSQNASDQHNSHNNDGKYLVCLHTPLTVTSNIQRPVRAARSAGLAIAWEFTRNAHFTLVQPFSGVHFPALSIRTALGQSVIFPQDFNVSHH